MTTKVIKMINDVMFAICCMGSVKSTDPTWRHLDKLPEKTREDLTKIKSDDIKKVRVDSETH